MPFIAKDKFSVRVTIITSRICVSSNLLFLILTFFSLSEMTLPKVLYLDNFKSQNSLKFSFPSIRGHRSNFIGSELLLESNSPGVYSNNFSVRNYRLLIRKDSLMPALAVYVKENFLLHGSFLFSFFIFLTKMRFSQSTHLQMYLSLETVTPFKRNG